MLISIEPKTHKNYGTGLLHFHQFCDSISIPEEQRLPAPEHLLAAFIASWAGNIAETTADSWLAGLHFWHQYNGAPWHGYLLLQRTKAGLAKIVPSSSKCPRHPPVTLDHMHALLGELVIASPNAFDSTRHVSQSSVVCQLSSPNGIEYSVFHIPWTKTTHGNRADIITSKIDNPTNPFNALKHHLSANASVPLTAPFFTFETPTGWDPMRRTWFLKRCNDIWRSANLPELSGHCFRTGGATELLLRGVPPDVVAVQGRWRSKAFLEYWRRIESILPIFITGPFADSHISILQSSMDSFERRYR
ncbi:DNA breaking-rejoining enzyme [Rhizopogon vinicolor AM-OR11-026]|uniref:DNA breaking-rejoining enzyme n=1 Tax=Rhizopogon vinicolor AM-OR11-026 TaxID=1314800 RepID=A0A1B7MMV7_9AGAM|nr:DNA breaking-rejoining enzyme [Rhizopogon vinicolor AM-OR11-026]